MPADPISTLQTWLKEAESQSGQNNPNAVALATANAAGQPSVRMVLLKSLSEAGLSFFTNYESRKGRDLTENNRASLCFFWDKLGRQVRIDGEVSKLSLEDSKSYFQSRPRFSQLSTWASEQSRPIPSLDFLEKRMENFAEKYPQLVPLPPHWGGYLLTPSRIEFWQERPHRLHERILYTRENDAWKIECLAP